MRISDWSSDVCSSDLSVAVKKGDRVSRGSIVLTVEAAEEAVSGSRLAVGEEKKEAEEDTAFTDTIVSEEQERAAAVAADRKSGREGKEYDRKCSTRGWQNHEK